MFNVWNDKIIQCIVVLLYRCTIRNARFIFFQKRLELMLILLYTIYNYGLSASLKAGLHRSLAAVKKRFLRAERHGNYE